MEKSKKLKIYLGIIYLIVVSLFLYFLLSNFTLQEITSYKFIQVNREYLVNLKESNILVLSIITIIFSILWVLLLGFGSIVALVSGFIFGKWIGTVLAVLGLSLGATSLYILANYFFKEFIKKKFSLKFQKLESKFKKNEFTFFLIYRFVGGIPFAISNVIPILFKVKLNNFFWGTIIGMLPQLFIIVSLGSGLESVVASNEEMPRIIEILQIPDIYIPIFAFVFVLVLAFILKKII